MSDDEAPLWQAIVFDFDGTLAKLNIDFTAMREAVLNLTECYGLSRERFLDTHILESIENARMVLQTDQPEQAAVYAAQARKLIEGIELEAARQGELFPYTRGLLTALRNRHIKTAIITRNCIAAVRTVFPDSNRYVDAVITREMTPHVKPHPDHLLAALTALHVDADRAVMVGDHPLDMKVGRDAGVYAIGVLTGSGNRSTLIEAGARRVMKSVEELLFDCPF